MKKKTRVLSKVGWLKKYKLITEYQLKTIITVFDKSCLIGIVNGCQLKVNFKLV